MSGALMTAGRTMNESRISSTASLRPSTAFRTRFTSILIVLCIVPNLVLMRSYRHAKSNDAVEYFPSRIPNTTSPTHHSSVGSNSNGTASPTKSAKSVDVCNTKVCWCFKKDSLTCNLKADQLDAIPVLAEHDREQITEITIENQRDLIELTSSQLRPYPNLEKLKIVNSGLRWLAIDSFRHTPRLKEVNLRNNQIRELPWKLFDGLTILELTIHENPLACNCSSKWLYRQIHKEIRILGPHYQNISCEDDAGKRHLLANFTFAADCGISNATINTTQVDLNETQSAVVSCTATGQ